MQKQEYVKVRKYDIYVRQNVSFGNLLWFSTKYFCVSCFTKKVPVSGKKIETELSNDLIECKNNKDENEILRQGRAQLIDRSALIGIKLSYYGEEPKKSEEQKKLEEQKNRLDNQLENLTKINQNNQEKEEKIKEIKLNADIILVGRCMVFPLIFTLISMIFGILFLCLDIFIFKVAILMTVLFPICCLCCGFIITVHAHLLRDKIGICADRILPIEKIPIGFNVTNEIIPIPANDKDYRACKSPIFTD